MAAAAGCYVAWAGTTAARAEQTAGQARAAAAVYETAFAETVPPPVIAANRGLLAAMVATNVFGQNTPAIATTEAQYAEVWAQDAAAMYGYAASSVSATTLTRFPVPPRWPKPWHPRRGSAQDVVTSAQQALTAVPTALSGLANPAQAAPLTALDLLNAAGSAVSCLRHRRRPDGHPHRRDRHASRSHQPGRAGAVGGGRMGELDRGLSVPRGWTTVMPVVRPAR